MKDFYEWINFNKEYLLNRGCYYVKEFKDEDYVLDYSFLEGYVNIILQYLCSGVGLEEILVYARKYVFYEGCGKELNLILILKEIKKAFFQLLSENKEIQDIDGDMYLSIWSKLEEMELSIYKEMNNMSKKISKFNKSFESVRSPLFLIKGDKFKCLNSQMILDLGYSREELYEMKCWELVEKDFQKFIIDKLYNCNNMINDQIYSSRIKIVIKKGISKWVDLHVSKVVLGGQTCIMGIYMNLDKNNNNIEEAKMLDEKLFQIAKRNKMRIEFFTNISHELRTPINVILGGIQYLSFMMKNNEDLNVGRNKIEKYLSAMKKNTLRMARLSNNLIDIIEIHAGQHSLNLENHDIVKIIKSILSYVKKYSDEKNINITFESFRDNIIMACDHRKFEKIILNILSNAIKFTHDNGEIKIRIFLSGNNVVVSIKDNGIGIPKNKHKDIFEKFAKLDKSLSREAEGTGIGLCIAKALVEMHDGRIELISDEGKGSDFQIILPNKKLDSNESNKGAYIEPFGKEKVDIEFSDIYI